MLHTHLPTHMRHLLLCCLFGVIVLGLLACSTGNSESTVLIHTRPSAPQRELRKIIGSYVDFDIETYSGISCTDYEQQFGLENLILIDNPAKLRAITRRLATRQPDTIGLTVDVRAKAVLFYSDQTQETLCMDRYTSFYRGQSFKSDSVLYQLLGVGPKVW